VFSAYTPTTPTTPAPIATSYASVPTPTVNLPVPVTVNPASTVVLNDSEIRRRVSMYLDHCTKVGLSPTLKNIQSAIKRGNKSTGLSYREIANVVSSLGHKV
jgi:hypothetical protein